MAAGDILSCEVLATGWQAKVIIEGFVDGGAYNFGDIDADVANAKLTMTVVSEGYNASGTLGTKTRYVYGTRVCQKAYPNHAVAEETESGGNVELTVALNDYVYDDDNTGAGKSGTAPTVTIASGWYTDSGTGGSNAASNATTALAVTNSSTQDYPKVIARWAVVPYQRVVSTFDLEAVAFHRFAESGKPVACVIFEGYEGATQITTNTVTAMEKSSSADSLPCYKQTLTASNYTDNAVVTCQFTAYPWVGDADSTITTVGGTANALTLGPLPLYMDSDDDVPVYYAVVNTTTGVDGTGAASTTYATAAAAPCLTIRRALALIHAANGNKADFCEILLQSNNHSWGDGTGSGTTSYGWLTITRDYKAASPIAKENACIVGAPNTTVVTALTRLYDITMVPTGFVVKGAAGRTLWLDQVANTPASQLTTETTYGHDLTYNTFCTAHQLSLPWASYSSANIAALIRGCSATSALGTSTASPNSPRCLLTTTVDHGNAQAGGLCAVSVPNTVIAYCQDLANPITNNNIILATTASTDNLAIVCNVIEKTGATSAAIEIFADSNATNNTNVLLWHNTVAGERANIGYNEGASAVTRANFSLKYNSLDAFNTKHDVFKTDATRTGAWSVLYGVGFVGNQAEGATFPANFFGIRDSVGAVGYTNDNSLTDSGTGNGDYTPDTGSVLIGKIATSADVVIPWDINGVAYAAGGCAGAITLAGGGGGGSRRIVVGML